MIIKILILSVFIFQFLFAGSINHIEYGASNHAGQNPTQDANNVQFNGITTSLIELLKTHEPRGRIYLNDIDEEGLIKAAEYLKAVLLGMKIPANIVNPKQLTEKASTGIEIVLLPGDMNSIEIPKTKTAMLRNPAPSFLSSLLYRYSSSNPMSIQKLINLSKTGLQVVTKKTNFSNYQPLDGIDIIEDQFPRENFKIEPINEKYYDFSIHKGFITSWANGEQIEGNYYKVSIKNRSCWAYY